MIVFVATMYVAKSIFKKREALSDQTLGHSAKSCCLKNIMIPDRNRQLINEKYKKELIHSRVYYKSAGKVNVLVLYRKEKKTNTTFHILYKGKPLRD